MQCTTGSLVWRLHPLQALSHSLLQGGWFVCVCVCVCSCHTHTRCPPGGPPPIHTRSPPSFGVIPHIQSRAVYLPEKWKRAVCREVQRRSTEPDESTQPPHTEVKERRLSSERGHSPTLSKPQPTALPSSDSSDTQPRPVHLYKTAHSPRAEVCSLQRVVEGPRRAPTSSAFEFSRHGVRPRMQGKYPVAG